MTEGLGMKGLLSNIIALMVAVAAVCSCEAISNFIHDDDVVARIGKSKLYRFELESYIPKDVSAEDSAKIASQYINTWAMGQLFQAVAEENLPKSELDVSAELEEYRKSLIRYRYEQQYVNTRLDTTVTVSEIEGYYEAHKDMFVLEVPIVKARFLNIMQESPAKDVIVKKMSSSEYDDLAQADSLAYTSALKYEDHSDEWVDMIKYAKLFGEDYGTVLSKLSSDGYIRMEGESGNVMIGYVCDIIRPGKTAPVDYCEPRIKDIIISNRKHALLTTLEQDLLKDALEHDKLIIE